MECFPCKPKVFFPPHVQSIWIEQVLRPWKNPRNTPRPSFLQSKSSKYTEKHSLSSSTGPLSNQLLKKNHPWSPCLLQQRKKSNDKRRTIPLYLRDFLTSCFWFASQKYAYAAWNLIPPIPCKYLDVIFFSVTFSPRENETRDQFTSGVLKQIFPREIDFLLGKSA